MGSVNKRNRDHTNTGKRRPWQIAGAVCLMVVCAILVGTYAKYVYQRDSDDGQVLAENFYFTTALSGDTVMLAQDDGAAYGFGEESTSGSWRLYGGVQHTLTIDVQNFYDALRITEKNISYTASLDAESTAAGAAVTGGSGTLTGGQQSHEELTLTIPSYTAWQYADDTVVTLTIQSTAPYQKTFQLEFHIFSADNTLKYRINDTVGSPYAELIIMSNVTDDAGESKKIKPYIKWPQTLDIDNTNSLTYVKSGDQFVQQAGMETRYMQVSEDFETGRSESIAFFKLEPENNYSCGDTVVVPNSDGVYVIDLTKGA